MNTLREEIKALFAVNIDEYGDIAPDLADQILSLIASKMPEKYELKEDDSHVETLIKANFNAAITEVKSILKGDV